MREKALLRIVLCGTMSGQRVERMHGVSHISFVLLSSLIKKGFAGI